MVNTSTRATIPAVRVKAPSALANLGQVTRADRRTRADAPIIFRSIDSAERGRGAERGGEREGPRAMDDYVQRMNIHICHDAIATIR